MSKSYISFYYHEDDGPSVALDISAGNQLTKCFHYFDNMKDASPYLSSIGRNVKISFEYSEIPLPALRPNIIVFYSADVDMVLTC